ncbi:hypothetical protein [Rhizobium mongolense]|uniref:Uncharacterized protein n=1 Tax=Rhizobium mongolense TaxID=57676 RepID=A0ABR6IYG8_9HYPH|nr:hypothetical protein [Rhizobium mongolense]MBB4232578.1 hypothetical protein [Rhizobium mongolense]
MLSALIFVCINILVADEKLADYIKRLDESDADEEKATGSNGSGGGMAEKIAAIKGKRDRHKALLDGGGGDGNTRRRSDRSGC